MSPLPDARPSYDSYTHEIANIRKFFERAIGPNEAQKWHVGEYKDKFEFAKNKGVDFKEPLEFHWKKDNQDKAVYSRVYSTNQRGVYLKIDTYDATDFSNPKSIEKNVESYTFYRLGKNLNDEYLVSITNG